MDSFDYQLTHPSGETAQATLDVTLEPSGDGVTVTPFMAMMSFSSSGGDDLGSLLDGFLPEPDPANDNHPSDPSGSSGSADGGGSEPPADPLEYLSGDPLDDTHHNVVTVV